MGGIGAVKRLYEVREALMKYQHLQREEKKFSYLKMFQLTGAVIGNVNGL